MNDLKIESKYKYAEARDKIKNGDILLASGNYAFSKIIKNVTDSCWSHVAFVMRLDNIDRVMVLESIETKGVRTIPLSEYVENFEGTGIGYDGRLVIARHKKFEEKCTPDKMKALAQFAIDRFSYPYDEEEIARITARIIASSIGFDNGALNSDNAYICSEYVYECYKRIGLNITPDKRGFILPADFAKSTDVEILFELNVNQK